MPKNEDYYKRSLELECLFDRGIDLERRVIMIYEPVSQELAHFVDAAMTELEAKGRSAITIRIMSDGGDVDAARAIVGRINASKRQVITEGYGSIMSAAVLILACGDKRRLSQFAVVMHHEASHYEIEGRQSQLEHYLNQAKFEEAQWAYWMAQFSNKPASFWATAGRTFDEYLTPQTCLEYGVVDEVF